jgi:hypothetical protein
VKVTLENRTDPYLAEVRESLYFPLPNLSPLESRYEKRTFSRRAFESFRKDWEGMRGEEIRGEAAARLVLLEPRNLGEAFDGCFDPGMSPLLIAAVWTLGPNLEHHASNLLESNKEIEGILFNVVGSLTLIAMHTRLQQWAIERVARPRGHNIVGEIYPGGSSLGMETLQSLLNLVDGEGTLGITCCGGELLQPLKSGCSIFQLGEGKEQVLSLVEPCNPCLGKKCLYYKMGGCHLTSGEKTQSI